MNVCIASLSLVFYSNFYFYCILHTLDLWLPVVNNDNKWLSEHLHCSLSHTALSVPLGRMLYNVVNIGSVSHHNQDTVTTGDFKKKSQGQ